MNYVYEEDDVAQDNVETLAQPASDAHAGVAAAPPEYCWELEKENYYLRSQVQRLIEELEHQEVAPTTAGAAHRRVSFRPSPLHSDSAASVDHQPTLETRFSEQDSTVFSSKSYGNEALSRLRPQEQQQRYLTGAPYAAASTSRESAECACQDRGGAPFAAQGSSASSSGNFSTKDFLRVSGTHADISHVQDKLVSIERELQETVSKHRSLQRQHQQALSDLLGKQSTIDMLHHRHDQDRYQHQEDVSKLESKVAALEQKYELQAARHRQLTQELSRLRRYSTEPNMLTSNSPKRHQHPQHTIEIQTSPDEVYVHYPLPGADAVHGSPQRSPMLRRRVISESPKHIGARPSTATEARHSHTAKVSFMESGQPVNRVAPPSHAELLSWISERPGQLYRAKYSYNPWTDSPNDNPESELVLVPGDYVLVRGLMDDDGFFDGETMTGLRGLVPSNYVERVPDHELFTTMPSTSKHATQAGSKHITTPGRHNTSPVHRAATIPSESVKTVIHQNSLINPSTAWGPVDSLCPYPPVDISNVTVHEVRQREGSRVPCPRDLLVERQLTKSLLISWSAPDSPVASLSQYHVCVDGVVKVVVPVGNKTKALVEDIDWSHQVHKVSVRSVNEDGHSPDESCTVVLGKGFKIGLPDPPANVQCEMGPQEGSLLITWEPVTNQPKPPSRAAVSGYWVYADGKKIREANTPTEDHITLQKSEFMDDPPLFITVRTRTREGAMSSDSNVVRVPRAFNPSAPFSPARRPLVVTTTTPTALSTSLPSTSFVQMGTPPLAPTVSVTGPAFSAEMAQPGGLLMVQTPRGLVQGPPSLVAQPVPGAMPQVTNPQASALIYGNPIYATNPPSYIAPVGNLIAGQQPAALQTATAVSAAAAPQLGQPPSHAALLTGASSQALAQVQPQGDQQAYYLFHPRLTRAEATADKPSLFEMENKYLGKHAAVGTVNATTGSRALPVIDPQTGTICPTGQYAGAKQWRHLSEDTRRRLENYLNETAAMQTSDFDREQQRRERLARKRAALRNRSYSADEDPHAMFPGSSAMLQPDSADYVVPHIQITGASGSEGGSVIDFSEEEWDLTYPSKSANRFPRRYRHTNKAHSEPDLRIDERMYRGQRARWFVALYDYNPRHMSPNQNAVQEELAFRKGQALRIFGERDADGFYRGEVNGRFGLVAHNLIAPMDKQESYAINDLMRRGGEYGAVPGMAYPEVGMSGNPEPIYATLRRRDPRTFWPHNNSDPSIAARAARYDEAAAMAVDPNAYPRNPAQDPRLRRAKMKLKSQSLDYDMGYDIPRVGEPTYDAYSRGRYPRQSVQYESAATRYAPEGRASGRARDYPATTGSQRTLDRYGRSRDYSLPPRSPSEQELVDRGAYDPYDARYGSRYIDERERSRYGVTAQGARSGEYYGANSAATTSDQYYRDKAYVQTDRDREYPASARTERDYDRVPIEYRSARDNYYADSRDARVDQLARDSRDPRYNADRRYDDRQQYERRDREGRQYDREGLPISDDRSRRREEESYDQQYRREYEQREYSRRGDYQPRGKETGYESGGDRYRDEPRAEGMQRSGRSRGSFRQGGGREQLQLAYRDGVARRMYAMYDYNPLESSPNVDSDLELSFRAGDVIVVYGDVDDDGFFAGECNGRRGLVPSNFLSDQPVPHASLGANGGLPPDVAVQEPVRTKGDGVRFSDDVVGSGDGTDSPRRRAAAAQAKAGVVAPSAAKPVANKVAAGPAAPKPGTAPAAASAKPAAAGAKPAAAPAAGAKKPEPAKGGAAAGAQKKASDPGSKGSPASARKASEPAKPAMAKQGSKDSGLANAVKKK